MQAFSIHLRPPRTSEQIDSGVGPISNTMQLLLMKQTQMGTKAASFIPPQYCLHGLLRESSAWT